MFIFSRCSCGVNIDARRTCGDPEIAPTCLIARWSVRVVAACFCQKRRPGCAPGGAVTFSWPPRESHQREGGPQSASPIRPVGRTGATCDARSWGGAAELAAFFELRSNSCGKSDHEACVSFGTHAHPSSCASRRSQQGWGAGTKTAAASQPRRVSVTRCALPTGGAAALASRAQRRTTGRAKQWPVWSPLPSPSDRAEKRRAWGERVPKDTRIVVWLAAAV